jgi:hypothetical protein
MKTDYEKFLDIKNKNPKYKKLKLDGHKINVLDIIKHIKKNLDELKNNQ